VDPIAIQILLHIYESHGWKNLFYVHTKKEKKKKEKRKKKEEETAANLLKT
jgi:hypothetical protein